MKVEVQTPFYNKIVLSCTPNVIEPYWVFIHGFIEFILYSNYLKSSKADSGCPCSTTLEAKSAIKWNLVVTEV
jgi:hypothetical protein